MSLIASATNDSSAAVTSELTVLAPAISAVDQPCWRCSSARKTL